ncbi:MAG TPA: LLM class flavin-dependent oxidoreductase, partial [Ktedonobacteraceae bacterium]|nr:LLM class flavin-dependent oxidoreductase [Ktedonobacteraceae bacterium]
IQVQAQAYPAPLQERLPIWITSSGNAGTWLRAAEIGANVLTALLQQSIEELEAKVAAYRAARAQHGLDPEEGIVTLMLHTFVWNDPALVYQKVREPLLTYMQNHMDIYQQIAHTTGESPAIEQLTSEDRLALADFAFQKYFHHNGLFGTPESCQTMLSRLQSVGVNEVACLMDFGIDTDTLLESLQYLNQLRESHQGSSK